MSNQFFTLIPVEELKRLIKESIQEGFGEDAPNKTNQNVEDEFLTIQEAADFLKVSLVSIHKWKRDNDLPYYRLGRSIRFLKKDLIAYAEVKQKQKRG